MKFLIAYVLYDCWTFFYAIGKSGISVAPSFKHGELVSLLLHPLGCLLLHYPHEPAYGNGRMDLHTHVNMVWHGVDAIEVAFLLVADAEDVGVQITLVSFRDSALAALGAPYDVVCEVYVCHFSRCMGTALQAGVLESLIRGRCPRLLRYRLPSFFTPPPHNTPHTTRQTLSTPLSVVY